MNTLPIQVKHQIFAEKKEYIALRAHWSQLMNSEQKHHLSAAHHLLYTALIGRDWRKAFTLTSSLKKLENGAFFNWGLYHALMHVRSPRYEMWLLEPFAGLVTPVMVQQIRKMLPKVLPYYKKWEGYANGSFPFAAYDLSDFNLEEETTMK